MESDNSEVNAIFSSDDPYESDFAEVMSQPLSEPKSLQRVGALFVLNLQEKYLLPLFLVSIPWLEMFVNR